MDVSKLRKLPKESILEIADMCRLDKSLPVATLLQQISAIFKEVESKQTVAPAPLKSQKTAAVPPTKYTRISQLGEKGKEGTVYLVRDSAGHEYALKQFAKTKSERTLEKEAALLGKAAEFGIAPKLVKYDTAESYIVMEKLEKSLFDVMKESNGKLSKALQREMVNIFKVLDRIQIFHADPSPLNFMLDASGKLRIIDFGFAKHIDAKLQKEHGTTDVNMKFMPIGFILKMKDLMPPSAFPVLLMYVNETDRALLGVPVKAPVVSKHRPVRLRSVRKPPAPVLSPKQTKIKINLPPPKAVTRKSIVRKAPKK